MAAPAPESTSTAWTIGHSNHPIDVFIDLLTRHQIAVLVDVRSSPYSGYASHFNKEAIEHALRQRDVRYLFLGDMLGGRAEGEQFYDAAGYVLYAEVARSDKFQQGIRRLLDGVAKHRVALMCGEEDPAECHRRLLVGRVLRERGVCVVHIRGDGRAQSEDDLAAEEHFRKTGGQLSLFDLEEPDAWKSTQSVLPKNPPPSSSASSGGRQSDA